VNAGEPNLNALSNKQFSSEDLKEFETLNDGWKNAGNKEHE